MQSEDIGGATLETWTVDEVEAALNRHEIVLIDVRTPQEYMFEHVEGALLMPMAFFKADALPGQSDKRIVLHCGSGIRSDKEAGITRIAHMAGGFGAWKTAKKPHIGTNMATGAPHKVI